MSDDRYSKLRASTYKKRNLKKGTVEYLWHKWYNKLWNAYGKYAHAAPFEPPPSYRNEFIRDVHFVVELKLAEIAPEKTTLKNR